MNTVDNQADLREKIKKESDSEAQFFDKFYTDVDAEHEQQNYIVPQWIVNQVVRPKSWRIDDNEYAYHLLGKLEGKKILDYGAGDGWRTISLAKANARLWAIDISAKGIELIRKKAKANGVDHLVTSEVRNGYETGFEDDMFDAVFGGGILHHLDLDAAASEIKRIMRRDGVAVFYEPIRDSKVMDIIKALVLKLLRKSAHEDTTENETPLTSGKIESLRSHFGSVNYRHFEVVSSASVLFSSQVLRKMLLWIDYIFFSIVPGYRKLGRTVVIELRDPIKK